MPGVDRDGDQSSGIVEQLADAKDQSTIWQAGRDIVQHASPRALSKPQRWALGAAAVVALIVASVIVVPGFVPWLVDRVFGGQYLVFSTERQLPATAAEDQWVLPDAFPASDSASIPPRGPEFHQWIVDKDGAQLDKIVSRIQVTNPRKDEVRITGLHAVVVARGPAWHGTTFCTYTQGNGQLNQVEVNLADPDPLAREPDGHGTGQPYFLAHGDITLAQKETITLVLTGVAPPDEWARWHARVDYTVNGNRRTAVVDDNGKPFLVSDSAPHYDAYFIGTAKSRYPEHPWQLPEGRFEPFPNQC